MTPDLDVSVPVQEHAKTGNQPWAGTFGFSDAVELPAPVDTRTNEVGAALEWAQPARARCASATTARSSGTTSITLIWDNPLRITDSPTAGPFQGRMSLWPDSNLNAVNVSGSVNLPARSRATAYVSVGNWTQNDALIPFTINTALPAIPLDRHHRRRRGARHEHELHVQLAPDQHRCGSRRASGPYDFDNRTPLFHVNQTVTYDTSVSTFAPGTTSPYTLDRKAFDAEVSYTPWKSSAFRAGYTRSDINQTFRYVDSTGENTLRLSWDTSRLDWLTLRAVYEHSNRTGIRVRRPGAG